ncbi:unnamed protein product [Urochloa decumbens]|uniref:RING-type domain-containing protein n=1 Tax=Urochloa decumbens TaxID=240449 RepID=A0ABC9APG8_9POAL
MATKYYNQNSNQYYQQPHSSGILPLIKVVAGVVVGLAAIALLAKLLHLCLRSLKDDDDAGRGGDRGITRPQPQPPAPAAVAVEMVRSVGPLVCTYRRADGWREASCAVCLAELADGDAVRVLPACMHYFHAECVGEWLRAHRTCPLCRAPLDPTTAAA